MPEGPHDARGYYTCECGRDRHGAAYNRRSVMHVHRTTPIPEPAADDLVGQIAACVAYVRRHYGPGSAAAERWLTPDWYSKPN